MLSYFGCDQSQVQRYLTAKSVDEARQSLLMSAYVKIPLQALVLLIGVLVFVFYLFTQPPMLFNAEHDAQVRGERARRASTRRSSSEFERGVRGAAQAAARRWPRRERAGDDGGVGGRRDGVPRRPRPRSTAHRGQGAAHRQATSTGDAQFNDVNYVFPTFVTTQLPIGLVGLIIAAIFAAAMSSIAGGAERAVDRDRHRLLPAPLRPEATDAHYLHGVEAGDRLLGPLRLRRRASSPPASGSLIEVVNRFGSFFYGSLLGVFVLAIGVEARHGRGAFVGLHRRHGRRRAGRLHTPSIAFLWHNVIGVVVVVTVGMLLSLTERPRGASKA